MAIITTTNNAALSVPVLEDAIRGAVAGVKLLLGTGAWIFRPGLPSTVGGAPVRQGTQVTVPYFTHIGELDDIAEGNALIPRAVTSAGETETVQRSGVALESTVLAIMTSQAADPYAEGGLQAADATMRRLDKAAITAALAVGSTNAAMVNNQSSGATNYPVLLFKRNAGVTWYSPPTVKEDDDILSDTKVSALNVYHATHLYQRLQGGSSTRPGVARLTCATSNFSEDLVLDTAGLFGDEVGSNDPIVMLAMHSAIALAARKLKDSTGRRLYVDGPLVSSAAGMIKAGPDVFCGIPVFVSDRLAAGL